MSLIVHNADCITVASPPCGDIPDPDALEVLTDDVDPGAAAAATDASRRASALAATRRLTEMAAVGDDPSR